MPPQNPTMPGTSRSMAVSINVLPSCASTAYVESRASMKVTLIMGKEIHQRRRRGQPTSAGPRHCIGEGFAMYEIATHLAVMSRRFRLMPLNDDPPHIEARINYRLRSDLFM